MGSNIIWYVISPAHELLLVEHGDGTYGLPEGQRPDVKAEEDGHLFEIPMPSGDGMVARGFVTAAGAGAPEGMQFVGLRKSFFMIPRSLYRMAGKIEELAYWDHETKFCGRCGAPLSFSTAISKRCPECGHEIWPALQIAIIVLIRRGGDELLLVRTRGVHRNFMGLVAGFVETGETLEEAVVREVSEETKLKIKNLRYFASQAWPYPCGLMAGFTADYDSGEIQLQREELTEGGWYHRNALPTLPDEASIARRMINAWLRREI